MKILEIAPFSAGICGVWQRVKQESEELARRGHEVTVFSSDKIKGTCDTASHEEIINSRFRIKRFPSNTDKSDRFVSKNVTYFNFDKDFEMLKPDIVITHAIHPHSFKALNLCQKHKIPCFLVTHAPFDVKRGFLLNLLTKIYYSIKVKPKINEFSKIIAITKWEIPYLLNLGVSKEKISYIPNGIPKEFFKLKPRKFEGKKIIFLGRIAPVKNLEVLFRAYSLISKNIQLEVIGPVEQGYNMTKPKKVMFTPAIYNLNEKIKKLQEADIFILPSKREAMPQSLIEAMALGKIVISSKTRGGAEIVINGKNGFLFDIGNEKQLAGKVNFCLNHKTQMNSIQKQAIKTAQNFKLDRVIDKLESLF